jgi:hypothetical protein
MNLLIVEIMMFKRMLFVVFVLKKNKTIVVILHYCPLSPSLYSSPHELEPIIYYVHFRNLLNADVTYSLGLFFFYECDSFC